MKNNKILLSLLAIVMATVWFAGASQTPGLNKARKEVVSTLNQQLAEIKQLKQEYGEQPWLTNAARFRQDVLEGIKKMSESEEFSSGDLSDRLYYYRVILHPFLINQEAVLLRCPALYMRLDAMLSKYDDIMSRLIRMEGMLNELPGQDARLKEIQSQQKALLANKKTWTHCYLIPDDEGTYKTMESATASLDEWIGKLEDQEKELMHELQVDEAASAAAQELTAALNSYEKIYQELLKVLTTSALQVHEYCRDPLIVTCIPNLLKMKMVINRDLKQLRAFNIRAYDSTLTASQVTGLQQDLEKECKRLNQQQEDLAVAVQACHEKHGSAQSLQAAGSSSAHILETYVKLYTTLVEMGNLQSLKAMQKDHKMYTQAIAKFTSSKQDMYQCQDVYLKHLRSCLEACK